jgi:membrane-bound lytic murein transglycosylase D
VGRDLSRRKVLALLAALFVSCGAGALQANCLQSPIAPRAERPLRGQPPAEAVSSALASRHGRSEEPVFALDLPDQSAVERRLARYLETEKPSLHLALERAGRLRRFIGARLGERGLPPELLFLPVLESRYSPRAVSRTGAVGLWQIARGTYAALGLRNDEWLDERRDFWKSTEAALGKLRENRERFGDWSLALAAYNCGSGCLRRIIDSSGIRDFWELRDKGLLPPETAEYVPAFFALVRICSNPQRYGLAGDWREAPSWERVELRQSLDLRLLAEALAMSPESLREANAELKSPITPPAELGYRLKVPGGLGARVDQLLADPRAELLRYSYHRLRSGDTFYGLSRAYGVNLSLIERANLGLDPHRLAVGDVVRIPAIAGGPRETAGTRAAVAVVAREPAGEAVGLTAIHTVRPGETLWAIARRYGTTPERLAAGNSRALDDLLKPGDTLRVPGAGGGAQ